MAVPGQNPRIFPGWRLRAERSEHLPRGFGGGARKRPPTQEASGGCSSELGASLLLPRPTSSNASGWKRRRGKPAFPHSSCRLGAPPSLRATPRAHRRAPAPQLRGTSHEPARRPGPQPRTNLPTTTGVKGKSFRGPSAQPGSLRGCECRMPIFFSPLGVVKVPTAAGP